MTRFALLAATTIASLALATSADAQWWGPRPSVPVYEGPTQISGFNPWTGQVDTHRQSINNTASDFGRNFSRFNNRQVVNEPVRDMFGNITGYKRGTTWTNAITGQKHGNITIDRQNGTGGTSSTNHVFAPNPMAGGSSPKGPTGGQRNYRPGNMPMTY